MTKEDWFKRFQSIEPFNIKASQCEEVLKHIDSCDRKNINPEDWDFLWVVAKRFTKFLYYDLLNKEKEQLRAKAQTDS